MTKTTNELTYAAAKNYLSRKGYAVAGYTGLGHTGWHRFATTGLRSSVDVRRNPTSGKIEVR